MDNEPKRENSEDLEELKEVIKKIEELQKEKNQKPKRPRRPVIAIEFGGVFHHNRFVNLCFNVIVNFTFSFFIIELFNFAQYNDIVNLLLLVIAYSAIEEVYKTYIIMNHFQIILKSFGTIFFFGYLLIFFALDQYLFTHSFNFEGVLLPFFVLIFTISRYIFGQIIRNYFRKKRI